MTVLENLEVGVSKDTDRGVRRARFEDVYDSFPVLHARRSDLAQHLSGGQQQMLAIGRALMSGPSILLLDEPSTGLAPTIVDLLGEKLRSMVDNGLGVLVVEQNASVALEIADRAYVMANGRLGEGGDAAELQRTDAVRKAYLGELDLEFDNSETHNSHTVGGGQQSLGRIG
jgi:branched-chain amino acid transport system ATP-binding protein